MIDYLLTPNQIAFRDTVRDSAEAVYDAVERAAECFGAMGVMLDMPLPKYLRDARMFLHTGVSGAVGKFKIAEAIAGFERAPN